MTPVLSQAILIVDDDVRDQKLFRLVLEAEGYRIRTATNGEDALASIHDYPPDLILLDVMLPGISGYQLAVMLKARPDVAHIPIVMITSTDDSDSRLKGLKAGAEEFLTKPVDRTELCLRVRNLLRLKKLVDMQGQLHKEILALNTDLEARVQQRTTELVHINKELESFAYSVSHDLRSPLAVISGFLRVLEKDMYRSEVSTTAKHCLDRIRNGALQMGVLIEAMLSLAHVSLVPLSKSRVDLSEIASSILGACRESDPEREAVLDIQPELWAQGDPDLLRLVMHNLLSNAWKFSSKKAQAVISFSCKAGADGKPVYAVQDNGVGFNMVYSNKLFSPFERLHGSHEFQGTGVGLATVSRIITRHGGRIWAESAPEKGAIFHFTL